MLRENLTYLRAANFLLDISLTLGALFLASGCYRLFYATGSAAPFFSLVHYEKAIAVVVIWSVLIYLRGERYVYRLKSIRDFAGESAVLVFYGTGLYLSASYLLHLPQMPRLQLGMFVGFDFALLFVLRLLLLRTLHYIRSRGYNSVNVLLVGSRERTKTLVDSILEQKQWGLQVVSLVWLDRLNKLYRYRDIPVNWGLDMLPEILKNHHVDNVIFSVNNSAKSRTPSSYVRSQAYEFVFRRISSS